ncbi:hypothetical protein J2847_005082 [Azospirillum agricola]|uniref:hypothetical protein n=1 Tax=Azospirillum agricola TaxID=1720247 RepID=UPI001AE45E9F|nr:hypothetical protein [Azospirillum agricola]MBP2231763.1 hypothetical protein [Azospirillum agricola]
MEIFEKIPTFDAATHRQATTYTDKPDPANNRIVRVWDVEPIPLAEVTATLKARVAEAVQRHLDATVAARNYASAAAAVSYIDDPNPQWDAEARAVRAWRSAVWQVCFAALDDVLAGRRAPLTPEEMIDELPSLVWPD